jgi:hypothetical protein
VLLLLYFSCPISVLELRHLLREEIRDVVGLQVGEWWSKQAEERRSGGE